MNFIREHSFSIFCLLGIIWLAWVILVQLRFKSKGVVVTAKIVGNKNQNGYYFPVFEFDYNGEKLTVDGHIAEKTPFEEGSETDIFYLPGNKKGVMRISDVKPKLWQIGALCACALYVLIDFLA